MLLCFFALNPLAPPPPIKQTQRSHEVCFKRCVTSADSSLSDKQKACLSGCQATMGECFKVRPSAVFTLGCPLQG